MLPPLGRGRHADDLSVTQRRVMAGGVVVAHVVGARGLLQVSAVREAVLEAAPMFVSLIAPPVPPALPRRSRPSTSAHRVRWRVLAKGRAR